MNFTVIIDQDQPILDYVLNDLYAKTCQTIIYDLDYWTVLELSSSIFEAFNMVGMYVSLSKFGKPSFVTKKIHQTSLCIS